MRRWAEDLLPESGGDAVLVASELAANAVLHTRSGDDGCFSVEVCRAGSWARIAVGDQGSDRRPRVVEGHGLFVVRELASGRGVDGDGDGRFVWADVPLPAGAGGPGEGGQDAVAVEAGLRERFPGADVRWRPASRRWRAVPGGAGAALDAPSPAALARMLTAWHGRRPARPSGTVPGRTRPVFRPRQPPGGAAA
jgi:hypothetical protein